MGATAFTYDWARRQTTIDPPDSYVTGTVTRTYRLDGLLATQAFPSSVTETLGYDAAKRPVSISLGAAGSISQAFDRAGNITSDGRSLTGISGDAGTNAQAFSYDALRRLTGSTGLAVGNTSNQYDLDGNRTRRIEGGVTTDFTYDRADQVVSQLIGVTSLTFDYDRYGNLVSSHDAASAQTTYAYDEASRLKTISPPGGAANQITFTLDALDRQASRAVNGVTTDTYAFADATEVAWQSGQGSPTTSLLDADGTRLAVKTGSTVSWLVFDLHGSVVALCPAGTSSLSDAYRFDGFGQQVASAGSATNPWRYRGLINVTNDFGSGALLDMTARHYAPQLGAFTQQDSVQGAAANPLSMNRFLYAHANPATLIDPDGHRALEDETCSSCAWAATANDTSWVLHEDGEATTVRRPQRARLTPLGRDSSWADEMAGTAWNADLARNWQYQLSLALAACGHDDDCERQAFQDHGDPFWAGFRDGSIVGVVIGGALAGICIVGTAGACAVVIVGGAVAGGVGLAGTCADHGCGIHGTALHVGGSRPWTDYERGNLLGGIAGGAVVGGPAAGAYGKGLTWLAGRGQRFPTVTTTHDGVVSQATDTASLALREYVLAGGRLFRQGFTGKSRAGEGQYWAAENPLLSSGYAAGYGLPDLGGGAGPHYPFVVSGVLKPGAPFVTRPAPGIQGNAGGMPEVVVFAGSVEKLIFSIVDQPS